MKNLFLAPVAACVFVSLSQVAGAQMLDEIEVRQEGANAVAQIKFVTAVQYTRSIKARASDLAQVFYTVIPTRTQYSAIDSEKRILGGGEIPSMVVRDEGVGLGAKASSSRKLVIRFGKPVNFRIRAGRNRSVEVVLEGMGSSVKELKLATALPTGRYVVVLQSSTEPGAPLSSSVPANLQDYQVFTDRRVVQGKTSYDTNLGYFQTRQEAQLALNQVINRFPSALIVELVSPSSLPGTQTATGQPASPEVETSASAMLATAQSAYDGGNYAGALESLNQILNLPPNNSSRRALELAGLARLNSGDSAKAKSEFELFLSMYPSGADSDRVKQLLAAMPTIAAAAPGPKPEVKPTTSTTGSVSMFYYGGNSNVRTQEFVDSALSGLPVLQSDTTLSGVDQKQLQTSVDLNWRYRDIEKDMRFVFRDSYSADLLPNGDNKNRLSALYFDYRSLINGTSFRLGRQSPTGGGVLYRFDGVQAGYAFQPKWKVNAVYGVPTDKLLDTRRSFYGVSVDAEALTKELSGSVYAMQQVIDGEIDRRGLGVDLRYFSGGISASGQLDFDPVLKAVNIAAFQGNWQVSEATAINAMADRRTTPVLTLGNVLFFQDPALLAPATRIQELLGTTPIDTLRAQAKSLTAYQRQARVGFTTTLSPTWQTGGDVSLTSVGEIKPVAVLLPTGQAATGTLWSVGAQLIGTNLYSARDTHVFNLNLLGGPTYRGTLLSYNNLTSLNAEWQVEPSIKYFTQRDTAGSSNDIWTGGLRVLYRIREQFSIESELTYERAKTRGVPTLTGPGSVSTTSRVSYYLGARYDF